MAEIVPIKIPFAGKTGALDTEDIRHLIMDRTVEDNPLELDLAFSDEEIGWAFRHAAMMYNAIPPYVNIINGPLDVRDQRLAYPFMVAVIYHLFLAKATKLSRQDIDYTAGNMQADFTKRRIEYLTKWAGLFKEESMEALKNYKVVSNLNDAYSCL
jgi:hypothetical protein